jgi:MFS family permease
MKTIASFFALYFTALLLLTGSGLFNTYMGLRLTAESVSELWVGALIAIYYLGLVFGARIGHKLIIQVGHIRAYAAMAAITTVTVLAMALIDNLWVWLAFRFVAGIGIVTQLMVIESWLNEQTENSQRGRVFAFYMVFSGLGTVLGQLSLVLFPELNYEPLVFVSICSVLCLVPVALTRRLHPALQTPAPIMIRYYTRRVPLSMTVLFLSGSISGAFYGLAPVYAVKQGLTSSQVAVFLAAAVLSGLVAQWPLGWLADRFNRVGLIRINAVLLTLLGAPLWGWWQFPFWILIILSCIFGVLQFTLYPLGAAFANDNVEPERRVGLSAILLMVYGVGACLGPLVVGELMRRINPNTLYMFVSFAAVILVIVVRPTKVTGDHLSEDAPTQFVAMSDSLQSSLVATALDPRVDIENDVSHDPVVEPVEPLGDAAVPENEAAAHAEGDAQPARDAREQEAPAARPA